MIEQNLTNFLAIMWYNESNNTIGKGLKCSYQKKIEKDYCYLR